MENTDLNQANLAEVLNAQDAQNRVTALLPASFIVEAPAGAGKTELLTQRYLKLLASVPAPEEIIALTFTKKAAAEMAQRILTSLQDAHQQTPIDKPHKEVTRKLAIAALTQSDQLDWQLLAQPSRLRILTMDALCSSLTRQMPLMSAFGGVPTVTDDASTYYIEAAKRAIAEVAHEDSLEAPISLALTLFHNDSQKLTELVADMLAKRDQWQVYSANLTHFDRHIVNQSAALAIQTLIQEKLLAICTIFTPAVQQRLMPIARFAASHLDATHPLQILLDWQHTLRPTMEDVPFWQALAAWLLTGKGEYRKRLTSAEGFPSEKAAKPYKDALNQLLTALSDSTSLMKVQHFPDAEEIAENQRYMHALNTLLMQANAHLWTIFQVAGEVDFIGIAERAQQSLGTDEHVTDLALTLDYQIRHLLIDEFQDTSPVQLQLIKKLTAGWQADDGRTLFVVGDPMQSIYRFRKAEVSIFLEVSATGIGHLPLKKLVLSRNNRAQPRVVDWINASFNTIFPQQDHIDHGAIQYRPFTATKSAGVDEGVTIHPLVLAQPSQVKDAIDEVDEELAQEEVAQDAMLVEAQHVAQLIVNAKTQDAEQSIAVLVRSRKHLSHLVTFMKRFHADLLFQAVEIEALDDRQTIQDALSLTYAMHHLADRVHWLNVLRAPWCGLCLDDLHRLAGHNHHATIWQLMQIAHTQKTLTPDGQQRLAHVLTILNDAFAQQGRIPTRRWVESTWLRLGGAQCLFDAGDMRDVNTFFDLVAKVSNAGYVNFAALNTGMQKLYAKPQALANDKVQFLTIHRSKGLEFDVVIVPGLNRQTRAQTQPLVLWQEVKSAGNSYLLGAVKQKKAAIYTLLNDLEKTRSDYETTRLLYVAATRAVRQLHLVATMKPTQKEELHPASQAFMAKLWPIAAPHFLNATRLETSAAQSLSFADFIPQLQRLPMSALSHILPDQVTVSQTSASQHHHAEATNAPSNNPLCFAPDIERHMGVLAHRYLELITKSVQLGDSEKWQTSHLATCLPSMALWLNQQGHNQADAQNAAADVMRALQVTLASQAGQWVLQAHDNAASELSLSQIETVDLGVDSPARSKTITHVIDRTFTEAGVRWIIDYKLAHGLEKSPELTPEYLSALARAHAPQLRRYGTLFTYEGLPIKTAVLFLSIGQLMEIIV